MRKLLIAALNLLFAASTALADTSREAQAAEKKLAGAAKKSFTRKCEQDAIKAAEKKLAGAAKNSFVKKCEQDA